MRRVVILLGPPGAGKGTLARSLVAQFGCHWLSSGELLREEVRRGSAQGRAIAERIDAGNFVEDAMMLSMIAAELERLSSDEVVLLDGFPRNVVQAEALEEILPATAGQLELVLQLQVERGEIERRILKRQREEGRADDSLTTLSRRLDEYETHTLPLVDYYAKLGCLEVVDAGGTPQQVADKISPLIRKALPRGTWQGRKEAG